MLIIKSYVSQPIITLYHTKVWNAFNFFCACHYFKMHDSQSIWIIYDLTFEIFICIHIIGSKSKSHANLCVCCFVGMMVGVIIVAFAYWFNDLSFSMLNIKSKVFNDKEKVVKRVDALNFVTWSNFLWNLKVEKFTSSFLVLMIYAMLRG